MKISFLLAAFAVTVFFSSCLSGQSTKTDKDQAPVTDKPAENLYIDVHHLGAGKVNFQAVAEAHAKDLATEGKYGAHFLKYWVDEAAGTVYCLSSAADSSSIRKTHGEAHGLLPDDIYQVSSGTEAAAKTGQDFFLDVHELGAGKVTAKDVAGAHQKDLATQGKYGVNFINYWVDEKDGRVVCLSQAPDSGAVIKTHKEAHGLVPVSIEKVKQGQ